MDKKQVESLLKWIKRTAKQGGDCCILTKGDKDAIHIK